jgi:hypothetical protein
VQRVVVLLDEVAGLVADGARKMADEKAVVVAQLPVLFQLGFTRQRQPSSNNICIVFSRDSIMRFLNPPFRCVRK